MRVNLLKHKIIPALAIVGGLATAPAQGAVITLELIDTYARSSPFGLAFDGAHIYWSDSSSAIHQMTTAGVDTGLQWSGPFWSELAWDSSKNQLAAARNQEIRYFDVGGGNESSQTLNDPMTGIVFLQDGLDIDHGEIWVSPDIGNVYRFDQASGNFQGTNPFLGGAGGYSGVERVDVGAETYVIVVNDALNPRRLCVHNLLAAELGCQNFVNQRYEGLAFDGRYLWAADFFGQKIDKFDVFRDGGSIFDPSDPGSVPEPATWLCFLTGMILLQLNRVRPNAKKPLLSQSA